MASYFFVFIDADHKDLSDDLKRLNSLVFDYKIITHGFFPNTNVCTTDINAFNDRKRLH